MKEQVFLGGACAHTSWRKDIAIPILEKAGISYHNPQMAPNAWTPEHQYAEMIAKEAASVWLFIINDQSRGIASIGEVAYRLGQQRKIALAITYFQPGAQLNGRILDMPEIDDINRGRVFLQAMAEEQGVPVFDSVEAATTYAVELARQAEQELDQQRLKEILQKVDIPGYQFLCHRVADAFAIQVCKVETNCLTGTPEEMTGRLWWISPGASTAEVVRTAFKAALTWEEHELRERFRYEGQQVLNPHFELK
jgi:hypothetical protein